MYFIVPFIFLFIGVWVVLLLLGVGAGTVQLVGSGDKPKKRNNVMPLNSKPNKVIEPHSWMQEAPKPVKKKAEKKQTKYFLILKKKDGTEDKIEVSKQEATRLEADHFKVVRE